MHASTFLPTPELICSTSSKEDCQTEIDGRPLLRKRSMDRAETRPLAMDHENNAASTFN